MKTDSQSVNSLPQVEKPKSVRELSAVNISKIKPIIQGFPEGLWDIEDARKKNQFSCFHHTRHIVFRFIVENRDPRVFESYPIWDVWRPMLEPLFRQVIEPYGFQEPAFPKVMLARLAAGAEIDRHVDGAGSNLLSHKIHIPIQTNPGATLTSNGQSHHLEEGIGYEVNNIAPHAAGNQGSEDRIHLIFEVFESAYNQE